VAGLAVAITQRQAQEVDPQEMTRMLAELEEM
jgi:hypothetical protein